MARSRRPRGIAHPAPGPEPGPARVCRPRRAWLAPTAALALAWALVFFPQLFLGQRFVLGDSPAFRPFAEFSRARWHATRQRTYWNPYVFMGIESVASLADPRPQYLPDGLLDLTEHLGQPEASPQLWLLLAHLAGALAVMALARALWDAEPWSALAGALVWLLAVPIVFPLTHGHDAQILADALLPVVVLATWAVIAAEGFGAALAGALGLALALGLQCLHGHPQILVYSSALVLLFALALAWRLGRWPRLLPWAGAVALGACIGAAVWWPALLYSALSSRGGGASPGVALEVVARYSLRWRDLLSLVWPQAVGFGGATYWGGMQAPDYSPYLGVVAITLALFGLMRRAGRGRLSAFWWAALLVTVAVSLGATLGPVFGFLHQHVPLWSKFRVPFYVLIGSCLALALLAARALTLIAESPTAGRTTRGALLATLVLGAIGLALAFPLAGRYAALAQALRPALEPLQAHAAALGAGLDLALRAALVAAALALLTLLRAGRPWLRPALVALLALDLGTVAAPALWRAGGPQHAVEPPRAPAAAMLAVARPHERLYAGAAQPVVDARYVALNYAEAYTNFWISWRTPCLTGNHGAFPAAWRPVMERQLTRYPAVLRAWGVGWLDADRGVPAPGLARLGGDAHDDVYALPRARGRAYAAPEVVWLPDEGAVADAMATPGFDPDTVAITTAQSVAGSYPGSSRCTLRWIVDEPERLALEVAAPAPAFVVIADSWFPGWTATVDGVAVEIAPTNLLVRGVAVPAGRHRLEMRYETFGMRAGVAATRAGLGAWTLLALAGIGYAVRRGRRRGSAEIRSATPAA
jgi:hypothetical protein